MTVEDSNTPSNQLSAREAMAGTVKRLKDARAMVSRVLVGQDLVVDQVFTALLCSGHVLIESEPGLGKTLLVKTVGAVCGMDFSRIQFTPDLMPADITGTLALVHDEVGRTSTQFQPGPIFAQMLLTDEINRATPKTQSSLLEAMQERTVTVAGKRYDLPEPFFVLATQNPIEMEGTYTLPEAQVDRFFFKVEIPYPSPEVLRAIVDTTTATSAPHIERVLGPEEIIEMQGLVRQVPIAATLTEAIVAFVHSTQPAGAAASDKVRRFVKFGVSPRAAQALVLGSKAHALLSGRYAVAADDVRAVALPALRHRFQLNFDAWSESIDADEVMQELLDRALRAVA